MPADESTTFELEMPAKAKYVGLARLLAGSIARRMRFNEESIDDLKIAISEVCTNAIVHTGNGKEGKAPILIRFLAGNGYLTIEVRDHGPGFDPDRILERKSDDLLNQGFGIPLIKSLVDEYECDSHVKDGTVVSITKFLDGDSGEI
ncbi:MAG: ATP-binding protein [Actinobacteria bacterium]|nr:ATP-binding protein [Actinomycetota bacterium]